MPATKSMPKEMLPVVDRPVIQYVVEEAVASGCDEILLVTGRGKRAIEDHFDTSYELERRLAEQGKDDILRIVQEVSGMATIHYTRQAEPKGLGDAVLCAKHFVGDEPFAVLLGDDIILDHTPATQQLVKVHEETGASAFSAMQVPQEEISRYGSIAGTPVPDKPGIHRVTDIVEKPSADAAPSTLATMGRYLFTPEIFTFLEQTPPGYGGEIQLTDAMAAMAREHEMYACEFQGQRLDVGSVKGFVEANVAMAIRSGVVSAEEISQMAGAWRTEAIQQGSAT